MAKQPSLVEIADMINQLSPNEMATLGKIVMAKQNQMSGGMQVSNVPGPMGGPPTGMTARPPQQLPPQMMQPQPRRPMPPTARDAVVPGLLR